MLLFKQAKFLQSQPLFENFIKINPLIEETHGYLDYMYKRQGRVEDILKQYDEAIATRPNYGPALFHADVILAREGKYKQATHDFKNALVPVDEHTPTYLYALAATYARIDDLSLALKNIQRARDKAAARGQTKLLSRINKDLRTLENAAAKAK